MKEGCTYRDHYIPEGPVTMIKVTKGENWESTKQFAIINICTTIFAAVNRLSMTRGFDINDKTHHLSGHSGSFGNKYSLSIAK